MIVFVCFLYLFYNFCSFFGGKRYLFDCFINLKFFDLKKKEKGEIRIKELEGNILEEKKKINGFLYVSLVFFYRI